MIDFYYAPTPNGWKIAIMLEECALQYQMRLVDLSSGEQFSPEFLAISPNNRIPAIIDNDCLLDDGKPLALFESGAILLYLAEKSGQFLPADKRSQFEALQWLFWQVGNLGPAAGQLSHFINYAPQGNNYALERHRKEYDRLLGVIERRLKGRDFILDSYSIADMAAWPWLLPYRHYEQDISKFPNLKAWHERMKSRPAVRRGVDLGKEARPRKGAKPDQSARAMLFEQTAASIDEHSARLNKKNASDKKL